MIYLFLFSLQYLFRAISTNKCDWQSFGNIVSAWFLALLTERDRESSRLSFFALTSQMMITIVVEPIKLYLLCKIGPFSRRRGSIFENFSSRFSKTQRWNFRLFADIVRGFHLQMEQMKVTPSNDLYPWIQHLLLRTYQYANAMCANESDDQRTDRANKKTRVFECHRHSQDTRSQRTLQ